MQKIPHLEMDYSVPPKIAMVNLLIGNPHSLILTSDQTIVGPTENSHIAVKTKFSTYLGGNRNPERSMVSYNIATNQRPTNANANAMEAATKTQVLSEVESKTQTDAKPLHCNATNEPAINPIQRKAWNYVIEQGGPLWPGLMTDILNLSEDKLKSKNDLSLPFLIFGCPLTSGKILNDKYFWHYWLLKKGGKEYKFLTKNWSKFKYSRYNIRVIYIKR